MSGWYNCPGCGCMLAETQKRCPVCNGRKPNRAAAAVIVPTPTAAATQEGVQFDGLSGYELVKAVEAALLSGEITRRHPVLKPDPE